MGTPPSPPSPPVPSPPVPSPPAIDANTRRVRAIARDERSLTSAAYRAEQRTFDARAAERLRDRLDDLLETMTTVVHDDVFWQTLATEAATPLSDEQLRRITEIDGAALAELLRLAGYTTPPRPPVDELVDEALGSLAVALDTAPGEEAVRVARAELAALLYRTRRQIRFGPPRRIDDHVMRAAARHLGSAARWLLPAAAGISTGILVQTHLPATGAGPAAGRGAQRLASEGVERLTKIGVSLAARVISGRFAGRSGSDAPQWRIEAIDPVELHLVALTDQLTALAHADPYNEEAKASCEALVGTARRHLRRLEELAEDHDLVELRRTMPELVVPLQRVEAWLNTGGSLPMPRGDRPVQPPTIPSYRPFGRGPTAAEKQAQLRTRRLGPLRPKR
ncbi:MAG TPA: hypothetical protein VFP34_03960 [Microlunatus sp.]|nr:hypothetical protein [Microlunatus sp.]